MITTFSVTWFTDQSWVAAMFVTWMLASAAAASCVPLQWRLYLDSEGIASWLFFWNRWTWADLSSGRITKHFPYTLYDPERPWLQRTLNYGAVGDEFVQQVAAEINKHYKLPPPPNLPESLTINLGFRRTAEFNTEGIALTSKSVQRLRPWSEVSEVYIVRLDPLRRDFYRILFVFPDEDVKLHLREDAELINEFVRQGVAADRVFQSIMGDPPTRRRTMEAALKQTKELTQFLKVMLTIGTIAITGLFVFATTKGVVEIALCAAAFSAPILLGVPMAVRALRQFRRQVRELQTNLDVLQEP